MQFLLRATVLGIFATAGVALAIAVAAQSRPATPATTIVDTPQPPAAEETTSLETPELPPRVTTSVAAVPPSLLEPPSPPQLAPYQPRIADRLDTVLQVLDQVRVSQDKTVDAVAQIGEPAAQFGQIQFGQAQAESLPGPALPPTNEQATVDSPEAHASNTKVTIPPGGGPITIDTQDDDIRHVLRVLSEAGSLNILSSPKVSGKVSASLRDVPIEQALTALLKSTGFVYKREDDIIYVGTPEELQDMAHVAEAVDTRIYRPNYVSAAELQQLVTPLLSADVGRITVSTPSEVGIAADSDQVGGDTFVGAEVVMVKDYLSILAEIDLLVAQVDQMPLQVAIEATILSVKLDDKDVLGVDFELLRNRNNIRIVSGTPLSTLATADFRDGLKVGFLDSSLFAFIDALETIGDTSVVASPRITCLNKQRAEILIGSELGYVSTTVTETAATQAVEFLEVGTNLRLRPFISTDGMVRMEVHPELSTGSVRVEAGFTLPDKDVTQVTTNIMCRSGATMVIGGLIREDLSTVSTQIPVLGNLPLVGAVFRQRTEEIDRREVIVLLTPRIVDEMAVWKEGAEYARQGDNRRDVFLDKMNPLGKRHYGERYSRLAKSAFAAGDLDVALRYANLAIHWDPLHQGAINLRTEILEISPELEMGVHEHLKRGLPIIEHPHIDYSRRGYPWSDPDTHELESDTHLYIGDEPRPAAIHVEPVR